MDKLASPRSLGIDVYPRDYDLYDDEKIDSLSRSLDRLGRENMELLAAMQKLTKEHTELQESQRTATSKTDIQRETTELIGRLAISFRIPETCSSVRGHVRKPASKKHFQKSAGESHIQQRTPDKTTPESHIQQRTPESITPDWLKTNYWSRELLLRNRADKKALIMRMALLVAAARIHHDNSGKFPPIPRMITIAHLDRAFGANIIYCTGLVEDNFEFIDALREDVIDDVTRNKTAGFPLRTSRCVAEQLISLLISKRHDRRGAFDLLNDVATN